MSVAIAPGSPEHMRMITPSKVAAILGVSRFTSPFKMWHQMRGNIAPEPASEIFALGHDFESAMASIWRRQNPGWRLSRDEVQIVCPTEQFGFPAAVTLDRRAVRGRARRILELKTARDLSQWGDHFTDQAPADYVAQVMAQMLFTGYTKHPAHLMVLGPFFEAHTYVIEYDAGIADAIVSECRLFWNSLQADEPPPLDDTVATYTAVKELHPDIEPGAVVQLDYQTAFEVLSDDDSVKTYERQLRGSKSALLDLMGNAATAMFGDVKIADRRPHARGGVALALATKNLNQLIDQEKTA
jgi:predicted phage-related endonuclease